MFQLKDSNNGLIVYGHKMKIYDDGVDQEGKAGNSNSLYVVSCKNYYQL